VGRHPVQSAPPGKWSGRLDNLTHSLMGAALAQVALRDGATSARRRLFFSTGVVASNLPDLDLVATAITPAPLGYLLHHRGHTHTLAGLAAQGVLLAAVLLLVPGIRRLIAADGARFWALSAAGLLSHLLMDAWNSYGVHPFHPLDRGWYYGDAVFIFEPWLWVLLGVAAASNASNRLARLALLALVGLLPIGLARIGIVPGRALIGLAAAGALFAWATRRLSPRARAAMALAGTVLLPVGLFGLSRIARARTLALLALERRGQIVDVVLSPNPASPVCWAVIAIEKDEPAGEYVLHRGTLSLLPRWEPPTRCASYRFASSRETGGAFGMAWNERIRSALAPLRDLSARDCWVRAWLQFGRAPYLRDGVIRDLRFEDGGGGNFTAMEVAAGGEARPCPPNMTSWAMPRADLLRPDPD